MDAGSMTQFKRGRTQYRPDTSFSGNTTRGPLYKRERSADDLLNSNNRSTKQFEQLQRGRILIPVFHEQSEHVSEPQNRRTRRLDSNSGSCKQGQSVNSHGENIGFDRNRITDRTLSGVNSSGNSEAIVFSKNSGVTRIPATRVRRHSVQYDGSGSLWNNRRDIISSRHHIIPVRKEEFSVPVRNAPKSTHSGSNIKTGVFHHGYSKIKVVTPDASDTIKPFFAQRGNNDYNRNLPDQQVKRDVQRVQNSKLQTNDTNYSCTTAPSSKQVSEKQEDRKYIRQHSEPVSTRPRPGDFSGLSPPQTPEVIVPRPAFIPVDLTPAQSENSSHIVCYKNSNNTPSSGYFSDFSSEIESRRRQIQMRQDMGVIATELPRRLTMDSEMSDNKAESRQDPPIYERRLSQTSLILTNESDDGTSDAEMSYPKRNIHVRRHSVSTPASFRQSQKPKLDREFQDWSRPPANAPAPIHSENTLGQILAYARATAPVTPRSNIVEDHGPRQPVGLDKASSGMIPMRRYSVTYIPRAETSDSDSGAPMAPVLSKTKLAPPKEQSKNKKRFTRRRCRPLSIVNESVSPLHGPDEKIFDDVTTANSNNQPIVAQSNASSEIANYQGTPTEVNIAHDDKNVNIVAGGNVHISLNTDKPVSMVGRSVPDRNSQFSLKTEGHNNMINGDNQSYGDGIQGPLGVWRQGNVMVDSVSPMVKGNQYQMPGFPGPQMYPGVPMMHPVPMMYYNPYLDPQMQAAYANQYAGCPLQAPTPQDKSLYSPLSLDVTTPRQFMPMLQPAQVPPHGLLQTAANGYREENFVNNGVQPIVNPGSNSVNNGVQPIVNPGQSYGHPHDVVSADDEQSPQPQIDVKDMIAGFEKRSDKVTGKTEFGLDYGSRQGSREGSRSRRVSLDTNTSLPVTASGSQTDSGSEMGQGHIKMEQGQEMCCQTDKLSEEDEKFKLKVEDRDDKWMNTDASPIKEPTTIHAYIAEMSISEVRYGNKDDNKQKS